MAITVAMVHIRLQKEVMETIKITQRQREDMEIMENIHENSGVWIISYKK